MALRVQHYENNKHKTAEDWGMHIIFDEFLGKNVPGEGSAVRARTGARPHATMEEREVQVMFVGGISMTGGKTPLYHCPFKATTTPENDMRLKKNRDDPKKTAAHKKAQEEKFDTLNEDRYIEHVLEKIVLPYIKKHQKLCPPGK